MRRTIYVSLIDEGTDVWAPVDAEHLHDNTYRIVDGRTENEGLAFKEGTLVCCHEQILPDGKCLVAYAKSE